MRRSGSDREKIRRHVLFVIMPLTILLCLLLTVIEIRAEETGSPFVFNLSSEGSHSITVQPGDTVTVDIILTKDDDGAEGPEVFGWQDEIIYDSSFLTVVQDDNGNLLSGQAGEELPEGIGTADIRLSDDRRAFYVNYVSADESESWTCGVPVGSFKIKVNAEEGRTVLQSSSAAVSVRDGSESYAVAASDLTITVGEKEEKTAAVIPEETGMKEDEQPAETDAVTGNYHTRKDYLTVWLVVAALMAGAAGVLILTRRTVTFDPQNGSELFTGKAIYGGCIKKPVNPHREGMVFAGWYTEQEGGVRWGFERDHVLKPLTLYARWMPRGQQKR